MESIQINVTEEQHKQLVAGAALAGKSIGEYVLDKALPLNDDEAKALIELEDFLGARVEEAQRGEFAEKSVSDIANEVYRELGV